MCLTRQTSSFLVGGDELAPLYQAFTFNTYEVFTNYSYSIGASGQDDCRLIGRSQREYESSRSGPSYD